MIHHVLELLPLFFMQEARNLGDFFDLMIRWFLYSICPNYTFWVHEILFIMVTQLFTPHLH